MIKQNNIKFYLWKSLCYAKDVKIILGFFWLTIISIKGIIKKLFFYLDV